MISFSCSKCGKAFSVKPEFAGRKTPCSKCKEPLVVPTPAEKMAPVALPKIAFSCTKCGMKFNVPFEFAGRSTQCPTCKTALQVPAANDTMAFMLPPGHVDGAPSSLARAGVEGGVTLGNAHDETARQTPLAQLLDGKTSAGSRYLIEKELARGGMGAVMCAVDCDIRREVAVKYLLDQSSSVNKLRFVEEAQITGQLEHPNIVPIHELGVDAERRIFFSMKMVKGRSLQDILQALRNEPKTAEQEFSQGRLLNIFVNVCNALDYAHSRAVVHRDLKPANIMVGDFGEVYVMDWGLAKVLRRSPNAVATIAPALAIPVAAAPAGPFDFAPAPPLALPVSAPVQEPISSTSAHVVTSRENEADLTQVGAMIGTPVYMPPEQAAGRVHDIDERSDIYSMGAILYEMMTLQPPVDRTGGLMAIVLRVGQGQIDPPEKRVPERAKAGKVPADLAAIAMKALATNKADRYQTIASLRHDIERFLEGRSVSAKPDTIREMAIKLVKRNQGVSIATAAATVILLIVAIWSFASILSANGRTQQAYNAYVAEQKEKQALARRSVPSLVRAARMLIAERQFDEALTQVNAAVRFDETDPDARLVRAQLLLHRQEFAAARKDLEACLKQSPDRFEAMRLLDITEDARPDHMATLLPLAKELIDQKMHPLAEPLTNRAQTLMGSKTEMLLLYQVKVEVGWPGFGTLLRVDKVGEYGLDFPNSLAVGELDALRGIPLSRLTIQNGSKVSDLAPLKGMPLAALSIGAGNQVSDLSPLQGTPLSRLAILNSAKLHDLSPLKGMRIKSIDFLNTPQISDLSPLQDMPLTTLNLAACPNVTDLSPLKGMPLTTLNLRGNTGITDLSPLKGMPLTTLDLVNGPRLGDVSLLKGMQLKVLVVYGTPNLRDLSPLYGMPLTSLTLNQCANLADLAPLTDMPLKELIINDFPKAADLSPLVGNKSLTNLWITNAAELKDLTPLKRTSLTTLNISRCTKLSDLSGLEELPLASLSLDKCAAIDDLTPLKGLRITQLTISDTSVKNLEPLRGMPVKNLYAKNARLFDLSPLTGMKLEILDIENSAVEDLTPLRGMPMRTLNLAKCKKLHDLSPLAGMKLITIQISPEANKVDALREMKSLTSINGLPPAQFWKLRDAAKTKTK